MKLLPQLALAAAVVLAAGCSWFGTKKTDEYKASARPSKPLEVPPELTTPTTEERFVIPDPRTQTTYSSYERSRTSPGAPAAGPQTSVVLPKIEGARIERNGDQRWLVVKGAPEAVWPQVHDFWIQSGFYLVREQPEFGIIETDWREDRAKIPEDFIRRWAGKLIDGMYSTGYRDKYRTRLEKGAEPGTTEIFVSHRGVEEVYTNRDQDVTRWQPRPNDKELEAEMLGRIMAKLGVPEATKVASAPGAKTAAGPAAGVGPRNAVLEANQLVLNDSFDRAWRRVGLALDRVGFTVEDRDRSKGVFYVRYIDPEADLPAKKEKEGFWESLKFWKPTPKGPQPQMRIHVGDAGGGLSQVGVQNSQGMPETSATSKRILTLLYDQLK